MTRRPPSYLFALLALAAFSPEAGADGPVRRWLRGGDAATATHAPAPFSQVPLPPVGDADPATAPRPTEIATQDFCNTPATPFASPQTTQLAQAITKSFQPAALTPDGDLDVAAIQAQYTALERSKIPVDELVRAKFMMLHWRLATLKRIWRRLARTPISRHAEVLAKTFQDLRDLGIALKPDELRALDAHYRFAIAHTTPELGVTLKQRLAQLVGDLGFGDVSQSRAILGSLGDRATMDRLGPAAHTNISNVNETPQTFAQWSQNPEFSRYDYVRDASGRIAGVNFHGLQLKVGDAVLVNGKSDGGWIFTGFSQPRTLFVHASTFAILTAADGRPVPVVVEQVAQGYRAVPLNDFFTKHQVQNQHYIEIFRPHDLPNPEQLDAHVQARLGQGAYGFDAHYVLRDQSDSPKYNTCSGFAAECAKAGGAPLLNTYSTIHPVAQTNLRELNYPLKSYVTPTDFARSPQYRAVGAIDMRDFSRMAVHEAAMREFSCWMTSRPLHPDRLTLKTKGTGVLLDRAQDGKKIALRILKGQGIPAENVPKGPGILIGAAMELSDDIAKGVRRLTGEEGLPSRGLVGRRLEFAREENNLRPELDLLTDAENPSAFDLYEYLSRPDVRAKAQNATPEIRRLFD